MATSAFGENIHANLTALMDTAKTDIADQQITSFNTFGSALVIRDAIARGLGGYANVTAVPGKQGLRITITPIQDKIDVLRRLRKEERNSILER